jgi:predicted CoA-substrate-specific enzyme activase
MTTLGLDIGSSAVKALVLANDEIVGTAARSATVSVVAAGLAVADALEAAGIKPEDLAATTVTGYGRDIWPGEARRISELSCHALGAHWLCSEARTVIDIGGQDFKAIALDEAGRMKSFLMNDKCAAGTGRFLDVMRQTLQLDWEELSELALAAGEPAPLSNTCTVFAESEVVSQLATGVSQAAVAAGVFDSVAQRVATLARRVGIAEKVVLSGGAVRSTALRAALAKALSVEPYYSPLSLYAGALGAALHAAENGTRGADEQRKTCATQGQPTGGHRP